MRQLLPLILACWGLHAAAQAPYARSPQPDIPGAAVVRYHPQTGHLHYVRFHDSAAPELASFQTHPGLRSLLGGRDLRPYNTIGDALGMSHTRLQAYHQGHPVEGAVAILHARQGRISALNATLPEKAIYTGLAVLTASQARENAAAHISARQYMWEVPGVDNLLRAQTGDPQATYAPAPTLAYAPVQGDFDAGQYRLAWKVDVYATEPLSHDAVYVDAQDGKIIWQHSLMHDIDAVGTAVTGFRGTRPITTDSMAPGVFRLYEAGRGGGIHTLNLENRNGVATAVEFHDGDNHWDSISPHIDPYVADVHIGMEDTYDFYRSTFNWNSVDNQGYPLVGYCHWGPERSGAMWDSYAIRIGIGDAYYPIPFATLNVIAHEFTHGLTQRTAGLYYFNEHGAIHEAFSDMMGKAVEAAYNPGAWNWTIGAELTGGQGFRDMKNPNRLLNADTYEGFYWDRYERVHKNSSVGNKWFQILVDGESGVNDNGDAYDVTAIGMEKAAAIAFRAITVYMTPRGRYFDLSLATMEAARDLYGDSTREWHQTRMAWFAVGLGPYAVAPPKAFFEVKNPYSCTGELLLGEVPHAGIETWQWDFGDGNTGMGRAPQHVYSQPGVYNIQLIVCNNFGCDTFLRQRAIRVNPHGTCSHDPDDLNTACEGWYTEFTQGRNYPRRMGIMIEPLWSKEMRLDFTVFDLKPGYDTLFVYDGVYTTGKLLGAYTGQTLPGGGSISSDNGKICVTIKTRPGPHSMKVEFRWQAEMEEDYAPEIRSPSTVTPGTEVEFVSMTSNILSPEWEFGDGSIGSGILVTHRYDAPGTYLVRLRGRSYSGCALSVTKEIHVCGTCDTDAGVPMLAIWPNPSTGLVDVVAGLDGEAVGRIVVDDVLGKGVLEVPHAGATSLRREIDLSAVEAGVYFVRLETDAGHVTRKLIVQH
jgi:Zn-dependent metalloprotease/PKD repeat protein